VMAHVAGGRAFAVETTLRTTAAIDQARLAREHGFATELVRLRSDFCAFLALVDIPGGEAQRRRTRVRRRDVHGDRGAWPNGVPHGSQRSCARGRTALDRIDEGRFQRKAARSA